MGIRLPYSGGKPLTNITMAWPQYIDDFTYIRLAYNSWNNLTVSGIMVMVVSCIYVLQYTWTND